MNIFRRKKSYSEIMSKFNQTAEKVINELDDLNLRNAAAEFNINETISRLNEEADALRAEADAAHQESMAIREVFSL